MVSKQSRLASLDVGRTCLLEGRDVVGASGAEGGLSVGVLLFSVGDGLVSTHGVGGTEAVLRHQRGDGGWV